MHLKFHCLLHTPLDFSTPNINLRVQNKSLYNNSYLCLYFLMILQSLCCTWILEKKDLHLMGTESSMVLPTSNGELDQSEHRDI